jgi:SAM-dependent methyltransferase
MPTRPESEYWDKLYQRREYVYGTAPNQYLLRHASLLQPGMTAFVAGDGEGRNGIWLAEQGLQVVSAERSPWGVAKAMRLARQCRVTVRFECCDLLEWKWPRNQFDVAVAMYLHLRGSQRIQVHRDLARCLKPGGILLLEAFKRHDGIHAHSADDSLFSAALLAHDFQGLEILELREQTIILDEGSMHQGEAEVVRVLARSPAQIHA